MCTLMPVISVGGQGEWTETAVNSDPERAVHTLIGDSAGFHCSTPQRIDLQEQRCLPVIADLAESAVPIVATDTNTVPPAFESGPQRQLSAGKLQRGEGISEDGAFKKETAPPSVEDAGYVDEHQTSLSARGSLCEAPSPELPTLTENGQQCHSPPPNPSLNLEAIEAIDWANGR